MARFHHPFLSPLALLLILSSSSSIILQVHGSPISIRISNTENLQQPNRLIRKNEDCAFPGNSDLYGLGIRVGIYLQLASTLLANACLSREVQEDARNTNAILMIAVFAGMAYATIKNSLNSVEIFIMLTLLLAFLFSDFTPDHISTMILFGRWPGRNRRFGRRDMKVYMEGLEKKDQEVKEEREATEEQSSEDEDDDKEASMKSFFAAIARSMFGTAIALFNIWYWFHGRYQFLQNQLQSQDGTCSPTVYLEAQVFLGGNQVMLYVIISVIYAVFECIFMAWWVFILAPSTIRLLWEILCISFMATFSSGCGGLSKLGTVQKKSNKTLRATLAQWYLGFARLDPTHLSIMTRFKLSGDNQVRLGKFRYYLTWFVIPTGYTVLIQAILIIEHTLYYNHVSGIHILSSTGQLIPFVVGLLGLLRNIHLAVVKFSERVSLHINNEEEDADKRRAAAATTKEIKIDWESGTYFYDVGGKGKGKQKQLQLDAVKPSRRWSIDSIATMSPVAAVEQPGFSPGISRSSTGISGIQTLGGSGVPRTAAAASSGGGIIISPSSSSSCSSSGSGSGSDSGCGSAAQSIRSCI